MLLTQLLEYSHQIFFEVFLHLSAVSMGKKKKGGTIDIMNSLKGLQGKLLTEMSKIII